MEGKGQKLRLGEGSMLLSSFLPSGGASSLFFFFDRGGDYSERFMWERELLATLGRV